MIQITDTPKGAVVPVRAQPGARFNGLIGEHDGALRVAVSAAPEGGKANEAIIRVLADELNLRKSQISLISGTTSKVKAFRVEGLEAVDLLARIESALEPTLFEPPDAEV